MWIAVALGLVLVAGAGVAWARSTRTATNAGPAPVATTTPVSAAPTSAAPSTPPATTPPAPPRYVFPVQAPSASYAHDHHDYPASDIIAPCGVPVLAATDGVILEVTLVDTWTAKVNSGESRGGLSVSLRGDDGVRYYGSHLRSVLPEIRAGVRVSAGQKVGVVGDTGDAGVCHLHFGISPLCAGTGDWWTRRGVIWPWPYLDAWRKGVSTSPAGEIAGWSAQHGCPAAATADP